MKNFVNKVKKIETSEISNSNEQIRKYSSPKRKNLLNLKNTKDIQFKKFSKTIKKQKNNLITINEFQKKNPKQIILYTQKEHNRNKKDLGIIINTSQNFTPNKRKNIQLRFSETQSKKKDKWIPLEKLNENNINDNSNNINKCLTKENKFLFRSNIKDKYKKIINSNTLILNFKKDIPNYQKVQSVNSKKSNINIENNSYILNQKRNILKGNIIHSNKKRNNVNKKNNVNIMNYNNYTIKISKNNNLSSKKKKKDNYFLYNEINKEFFKSYIINKYSISFVKNPMKMNEELKRTNYKLSIEKNIKKHSDIQYKTNFNFHKSNNSTTHKSFVNKKMTNSHSKVKSSVNIKENKKSNVIKKKTHSSLVTKKNSDKLKKTVKFLDKNNIHQMTDFSESYNNNSIPISINKIKFDLNKKLSNNNMTERDEALRVKDEKSDGSEKKIIKKIKKNLNLKKICIERKNRTHKKEKSHSLPYSRINSHKILITNININLYKDSNDTNNKQEDNIDNIDNINCINSDQTRATNLNLDLNESIIDLEKIYLLEEKIHKILSKINEYSTCDEECQNFITFYFSVNFYKKELELFKKSKNQKKISNYMKLEIICYFLCYDISLNENFNQASILLKTIMNILHDNYLILMSYILYLNSNNLYENNSTSSLWLNKIQKIIDSELKINLTSQDMNENSILSIIVNSTQRINNYYIMIIDNLYNSLNDNSNDVSTYPEYIFPNCLQLDLNKIDSIKKSKITSYFFLQAYKLLNNYSFENMKLFFYLFLNNPKFGSKNNSPSKNNNNNNNNIYTNINLIQYYLPPIKPNYKYSLILNLDETLIYNNNGKIILRPNLYEFLNMMKDIYELIIFSFESNSFIDSVVDMIEEKNKYFDYILYANQFTLNNNGSLVKDLESLGRNLKNIIVIDSKSHLDNKYKNNLILIKGFYGNNLIDINLLKILGYILQNIKKENYDDDIRLSIDKHKNTIKAYLVGNS